MGRATVELDLNPAHARDLSAGGVYVVGCTLGITEECDLLLRAAAGELPLTARVVFVDPSGRGAGLEVVGFNPELRQRIAEFAVASVAVPVRPSRPARPSRPSVPPPAPLPPPPPPELQPEPDVDLDVPTGHAIKALALEPDYRDVSAGSHLDLPFDPSLQNIPTFEIEQELDLAPPPPARSDEYDVATTPALAAFDPDATQPLSLEEMDDDGEGATNALADPLPAAAAAAAVDADADAAAQPDATSEADAATAADTASDAAEADPSAGGRHALAMHERLRGLSVVQQLKFAHTGEMQERILLERLYGKTVWEALLRNPRITGQEVARIARMGALPRPLIEQIVGNGGWLQIPEVRRALLTHPRLQTDQIIRVLRLLPKPELKLAVAQNAYPMAVREQARKLLGGVTGR